MRIGFTGTRSGMNINQKQTIEGWLTRNRNIITEAHHGDCSGADKEFHDICNVLGFKIIIHPPTNSKNRAFCKSEFIEPEHDYLVRNRHIVDSCDVLLATPKLLFEEQRSGTWHAIRYALGKKPVHVFYIDGTTVYNLPKV